MLQSAKSFCSWDNLGKINDLTIVNYANYSILSVPIISGILHFAKEVGASFHIEGFGELQLPSYFLVLYVSGVFVVFSKVIFSLFCPSVISFHGKFENYLKSIVEYKVIAKKLHDHSPPIEINLSDKDLQNALEMISSQIVDLKEPDFFEYKNKWAGQNTSRPIIRILLFILFALGGATSFGYLFFWLPFRVFSTL